MADPVKLRAASARWRAAHPEQSRASQARWRANNRVAVRRNRVADQRRKVDALAAIKLRRGCADCAYRVHPDALEFDHLPDTTKVASVSSMVRSASMARILAEVEKCEVVCANCHRIRTSDRRTV